MLPSEAQREWIARGSNNRSFPWGDEQPNSYLANFNLNNGKTTPVGAYPNGQTPEGIQDLAGNVWEWCLDSWDDEAYQSRVQLSVDPVCTSDNASAKVLRGGSWLNKSDWLRSTFRIGVNGWEQRNDIGFRCVLVEV